LDYLFSYIVKNNQQNDLEHDYVGCLTFMWLGGGGVGGGGGEEQEL
jgi:hypothetical protein